MVEVPYLVLQKINPFLPQVFYPKTWGPKTIEWHNIQQKTYFISSDTCSSSSGLRNTQAANFQSHKALH
jgi:hypothetical protein